jgi:hypothetical protein
LCSNSQLSFVIKYLKDSGFIVESNALHVVKSLSLMKSDTKSPVIHGVVAHLSQDYYVNHNTAPNYALPSSPYLPRIDQLDKLPSKTNIISEYLPPAVYLTSDQATQCKRQYELKKKPKCKPLRTNERNVELFALLIHRWCRKDGRVFNPFTGTGSTAIACLIMGVRL